MRSDRIWRLAAAALLLALAFAALDRGPARAGGALPLLLQDATPAPGASCDRATPVAGGGMAGMDMGTPMAGMDMAMETEFDQLYIDMMLPHHASIVAMAQAALPRLTDPRLQEVARTIVAAQSAEIEELRGYRERFYGDPDPAAMDGHTMDMMMAAMPGMGSMDAMAFQMDAAAQVAAICAAEDADLAFIDLTIPHHEMAIAASEAALAQAVHPEIRDFARRVIDDQRREIEALTAIRTDLYGEGGTPIASPAAGSGEAIVDGVGLADALRARGLAVEPVGPVGQPFLRAESATILRLSGGELAGPAEVQAFEYGDAAAAEADAAQIGPDGNPRTAIVEWVAPPHFFLAGRLVVLYVGADEAVVDLLTDLVGPQFAGR